MSQPYDVRLNRFLKLFKGYLGLMPLATAALAPLLTALNVLPIPEHSTKTFATMTGLFGFLMIAWLFSVRRFFAQSMIAKRYFFWMISVAPLALIGCSAFGWVYYLSLNSAAGSTLGLMFWYLFIFLTAEAAFIFMALQEYIQDVFAIPEYVWLHEARPMDWRPEPEPVLPPTAIKSQAPANRQGS